jgi:hypothetical protein
LLPAFHSADRDGIISPTSYRLDNRKAKDSDEEEVILRRRKTTPSPRGVLSTWKKKVARTLATPAAFLWHLPVEQDAAQGR